MDIVLDYTNSLKWIIACRLSNAMCFSANIQMPNKLPVHPPNIYVLELSHASTKCTHGIVVKLFCRLMSFPSRLPPTSATISNPWKFFKMSCV